MCLAVIKTFYVFKYFFSYPDLENLICISHRYKLLKAFKNYDKKEFKLISVFGFGLQIQPNYNLEDKELYS